jgi:protein SCO1/2
MNFLLTLLFLSQFSFGVDPNQTKLLPDELQSVGIDKSVKGTKISLDTKFTDEEGEIVPLSSQFLDGKPILLSMVYYNCPGLCSLHMNGAGALFQEMALRPGEDFNWVTVSMDHTEGPELAVQKKISYMDQFPIENAEGGWRFLTSINSKEGLDKLTKELGFSYKWDEKTKQFAHSAAFYAITPEGVISQIIPGVGFDKKTVRLSLVDASKGSIGDTIDQLLLFCFTFDSTKNKYVLYSWNIMRVASALTVIILGIILVPMWMKEKSKGVNT